MDGGDLWFTLVSNTYKYKYSLLPRLSMDCRMILRQLDCYYCYVKQIYPKSVLFRWKTTFAPIFFLLLSANTSTSGEVIPEKRFPPQKRQKDLDWSFLIVFTITRQWIFRVSTVTGSARMIQMIPGGFLSACCRLEQLVYSQQQRHSTGL